MLRIIKYLAVIGLLLNFIGAIILSIPLINSNKYFSPEKDKIIDKGMSGGEFVYTTGRDEINSGTALLGAGFMIIGFGFQLVAERYRI